MIVRLKTHEMSLSSEHRNQTNICTSMGLMCVRMCASMSHNSNRVFHLESGFMALSTATRTQAIDS